MPEWSINKVLNGDRGKSDGQAEIKFVLAGSKWKMILVVGESVS